MPYSTPNDIVRQRAMDIIKENRIQQVPSLQHWSVEGSSGDIYVVKLFKAGVRHQTCTCAASAICSHILAAMYSIDCEMLSKKNGNLTAIQRKRRTQQRYRRSGKKPPSKLEKNSIRRKENESKKMSAMPKRSNHLDTKTVLNISPNSERGFNDRFSPRPSSIIDWQTGLSPSFGSPPRSWTATEPGLLYHEHDGLLTRSPAGSPQSLPLTVPLQRIASVVGSPHSIAK